MQGNKENMNISNWNNCNNNSNMREGNHDSYINNPKNTQHLGEVNNSLESNSRINLQENDIYENDATSYRPLEQESSLGIYLTTEGANEIEPSTVVNDDDIYVKESPTINTMEMDTNSSGTSPTNTPEEQTPTNGIYVNDSPNSGLPQQKESKGVYLTNLPDDGDIYMHESKNSTLPQRHIDGPNVYMAMDSEDSNKAREKQDNAVNDSVEVQKKKLNINDPYMVMGDLTNKKPLLPDTGVYLTNPDDKADEKKTTVRYVDNPTNTHTSTNDSSTEPKRGYVMDPKREVYIDILDPETEDYKAIVNERKLRSDTLEESACHDESAAAHCEDGYLLPRERRNNGRTNDGELRYVPDPTTGSPQPPPTNTYYTIDDTVPTERTGHPPDEQLTQVQATPLITQSERSPPENSTDGQQDLYSALDEVAMQPAMTQMTVQKKGKSGIKCWQIVCLIIAVCVLSVGIAVWAALEGQAPKPTQSMLLNGTGMATAVAPSSMEAPSAYACDPTTFTGVGAFENTEMIKSGDMVMAPFVCPEGYAAVNNYPERHLYPVCRNGAWDPIPQCAQITTTTPRPTTAAPRYCELQNTKSVKFDLARSNQPFPVGSSPTRKVTFKCEEGYAVADNEYTYCINGVLIPAPNCTEIDYGYDY